MKDKMLKRDFSSDGDGPAHQKKRKTEVDYKKNGTRSTPTNKFTVGWICAISTERTAATAFLDERFDAREYNLPDDDNNDYTLGRIGEHYVAITALPEYGTDTAAAVAKDMMRSFPSIKTRLMVGIGGGAPTAKHDIRLGDIVVSVPYNGKSGVLQYDFGKTMQNQEFQMTRVLNQPPQNLLSAVHGLRTDYETQGHLLEEEIESTLQRLPRLRETCQRPDQSSDRLYKSDVIHPRHDDRSCSIACGGAASSIVPRIKRPSYKNITIHYGLVACANQVMKDATTRDKLALQNEVLCFEMEAAGLMNDFSCLVIRGICDYSDSHKNKDWQGYAAMAAAAYAKDLLNRLRPICVKPSNIIPDKLESDQRTEEYRSLRPDQAETILKALSFEQIGARHLSIDKAHASTCKWLLKNQLYLDWLDPSKLESHHGFLWIKGKAGIGKSTLMKYVHTNAQKKMKHEKIISFYFNARGEGLEKSTTGMYRTLLLQLFEAFPELQNILYTLPLAAAREDYHWNVQPLKSLFEDVIRNIKGNGVVCFIDALDECDEDEIRDMVSFFQNVGEFTTSDNIKFLVCFSSRHYPHISKKNALHLMLEGQEGHDQDICNYIHSELKIGESKLAEDIRATVRRKSAGIFMWVILVVEILNKEYDGGRIHKLRQQLDDIPEDLHQLFRNILTRDDCHQDDLLLCIQWLLFSRQPLKPQELYFAVLSDSGSESVDSWNIDEISMEDIRRFIISCSKGLAEITKSKSPTVQFIHESVKDFLLKEEGLKEICTDFGDDFRRESHKRLKQCCLKGLNDKLGNDEFFKSFPRASSWGANNERQRFRDKYPFLNYAVRNVIYHANAEEMNQDEQAILFQTFNLKNWIALHNVFEKYKSRQLDRTTTELYVLAIHNAGNLIRYHPLRVSCFETENNRYGLPMLAALVANNYDAVGAFLEAHARAALSENHPKASILHQLCKDYVQETNKRKWHKKEFQFSQRKSFLSYLAEYGDVIVASFWLNWADVDINLPDKMGDTALLMAAGRGNCDVLNLLLKSHADIQVKNKRHELPLHRAAHWGSVLAITILLEAGADISAKDRENRSPLHFAVAEGHTAAVEVLLEAGAAIDVKNKKGESPLFIAARKGLESIVKILLNAGANVEVTNEDGESAVWAATRKGNIAVFKMLLEAGADLEAKNREGKSLLHPVVQLWRNDFADVLWRTSAETCIQLVENNNESLLHKPARYGDENMVKFLLNAGADVRERFQGALPLHLATQGDILSDWKQSRLTIVTELLLKDAATVNERDDDGRTPLLCAILESCRYGPVCETGIDLLIQSGADVNLQALGGETPLHVAGMLNWSNVVKLLLKAGADIEARDNHGRTPLHWACTEQARETPKILLECGADVEAKDHKGETPLHIAAYGSPHPVQFLIAYNANQRARNNNNLTPLEIAQNHFIEWPGQWWGRDVIDLLSAASDQPRE